MNIFAKRYQELLKSTAPDWIKRGAYRYLLRYLSLDEDNLEGTQQLLESVGIKASEKIVKDFVGDAKVGIEHIDEILVRKGMATDWVDEDETWYLVKEM